MDKEVKIHVIVKTKINPNYVHVKNVVYTEEEWIDITENKIQPEYDKMILSLKKGIPDKIRGKIWIYLGKCIETASKFSSDIYNKLKSQPNEVAESDIKKDLHRTFSISYNENIKYELKQKEEKLYNILLAYANFDHEVGYVQGNNYIVNTILSNINSERAAFWLYFYIMNDLNWRYLFIKGMPKLVRMINILMIVIKKRVEKVYEVIQSFGEENEMFTAIFTSFFVCIFCYNCPLEYSNRILDLFWVLEEKIIIESIVHLLELNQAEILQLSMDKLIPFISEITIYSIEKYGLEASFAKLDKFNE